MNLKEKIFSEVIESNFAKYNFSLRKIWNEIEKRMIIFTLIREDGDTMRTSVSLGLSYSTLHTKIRRLKIQHFSRNKNNEMYCRN